MRCRARDVCIARAATDDLALDGCIASAKGCRSQQCTCPARGSPRHVRVGRRGPSDQRSGPSPSQGACLSIVLNRCPAGLVDACGSRKPLVRGELGSVSLASDLYALGPPCCPGSRLLRLLLHAVSRERERGPSLKISLSFARSHTQISLCKQPFQFPRTTHRLPSITNACCACPAGCNSA